MTGHYGRGPGLKLLAEAVAAIAYPGCKACRGQAAKGKGRVRQNNAPRWLLGAFSYLRAH